MTCHCQQDLALATQGQGEGPAAVPRALLGALILHSPPHLQSQAQDPGPRCPVVALCMPAPVSTPAAHFPPDRCHHGLGPPCRQLPSDQEPVVTNPDYPGMFAQPGASPPRDALSLLGPTFEWEITNHDGAHHTQGRSVPRTEAIRAVPTVHRETNLLHPSPPAPSLLPPAPDLLPPPSIPPTIPPTGLTRAQVCRAPACSCSHPGCPPLQKRLHGHKAGAAPRPPEARRTGGLEPAPGPTWWRRPGDGVAAEQTQAHGT